MSKNTKGGRAAMRLWRGLTTVTAVLLAVALVGQVLVEGFRTDIDKFPQQRDRHRRER